MKKQIGAGMIEVLVAIVICAIGLLGLISLQTNSGKNIQETRYHEQANFALNEMISILIANKTAAVNNDFNVNNIANGADITAAIDCVSHTCNRSQLASYELANWFSAIKVKVPSPRVSITTAAFVNPSGTQVTIQILWDANLNAWSVASVPSGDVCNSHDPNYPCLTYSLWMQP